MTAAAGSGERSATTTPAARVDAPRLRALFDMHFGFIWRLLARRGVPEADVDDAAQQVFMVLAGRNLATIKPGSERAFLFGVAVRVAHTHRRARTRRPEEAAADVDRPDDGPRPDEIVDHRRACRMLDRILDEMPDDVRTVFILFELEELTMSEIATVVSIPPGTVASRLRRGRALFQERAAALSGRIIDRGENR